MNRHDIEQVVRREIERILETAATMGGGESLAVHGLDSLRSVELTLCLEDAFEIVFDDEEINLDNFADIDSIVALLDGKLSEAV